LAAFDQSEGKDALLSYRQSYLRKYLGVLSEGITASPSG